MMKQISTNNEPFFSDLTPFWSNLIQLAIKNCQAIVIGIFSGEGEVLFTNQGMRELLLMDEPETKAVDSLVNPDFKKLLSLPTGSQPIFEGMLTAGNRREISRTVYCKIYRNENNILIVGEYDIRELDRLNRELNQLNRENNNLQRKLIQEKKKLEYTLNELKKTQGMLIHSEKMNALGNLVAGVAHEINNPLAFVSSNLHSLRDAVDDMSSAYRELENISLAHNNEKMKDSVNEIREKYDLDFVINDFEELLDATVKGVSRVSKIVRDLKTFSRMDEGDINEADISESIQSTLSIVEGELKKRNIEVILDLENLPTINCYSSELNQVFLNLVVNAMDAMPEGGVLTIKGTEIKNSVRLEFADTGTGIPEEKIDRIFDPFYTTKPVGKGTGLGLSIAYSVITDKHHGAIRVDSKSGEGSVFTIELPVDIGL